MAGQAGELKKDDGEVEVTSEMVEAGLKIFYESGVVDGPLGADKLLLREIYRAMVSCSGRRRNHLETLDSK